MANIRRGWQRRCRSRRNGAAPIETGAFRTTCRATATRSIAQRIAKSLDRHTGIKRFKTVARIITWATEIMCIVVVARDAILRTASQYRLSTGAIISQANVATICQATQTASRNSARERTIWSAAWQRRRQRRRWQRCIGRIAFRVPVASCTASCGATTCTATSRIAKASDKGAVR